MYCTRMLSNQADSQDSSALFELLSNERVKSILVPLAASGHLRFFTEICVKTIFKRDSCVCLDFFFVVFVKRFCWPYLPKGSLKKLVLEDKYSHAEWLNVLLFFRPYIITKAQ